jgi:hypothetical protein
MEHAMKKFIGLAAAVLSVLPLATFSTTSADARGFRGGHGYHGGHGFRGGRHWSHGYGRHHGRGYWRNGRWIALGVGAAIAGAAAADYYGGDCYYRYGYRYCD